MNKSLLILYKASKYKGLTHGHTKTSMRVRELKLVFIGIYIVLVKRHEKNELASALKNDIKSVHNRADGEK